MSVERKKNPHHQTLSWKEININTFIQYQNLRLTLLTCSLHESINREFWFLCLCISEEWTWSMHPSVRSSQTTAPLLAPCRSGRGGQVMLCAHTVWTWRAIHFSAETSVCICPTYLHTHGRVGRLCQQPWHFRWQASRCYCVSEGSRRARKEEKSTSKQ